MKKCGVPIHSIERRIIVIQGHAVMLDSDLARLYGVKTGNLNLAVKRNITRFPPDFMFQISLKDAQALILQSATSKSRGGVRKPLNVFTEQGVAMLSSVLNSERAIQVNIHIMRAFTRLKEFHISYENLKNEISSMRNQYDKHFSIVFDAINSLLDGPKKHFKIKGFGVVENQKRHKQLYVCAKNTSQGKRARRRVTARPSCLSTTKPNTLEPEPDIKTSVQPASRRV
jgi:hypothetical protein